MTQYVPAMSKTMFSSTMVFADIRCRKCSKLIVKWLRSGEAILDVKCSRCGSIDVLHLST
jgi:phage FluMu protein Com